MNIKLLVRGGDRPDSPGINEQSALYCPYVSLMLVQRLHIDLQRTSSAVCPQR